MTPTWRTVPPAARTVFRWATIVLAVGYTVSLLFVFRTTHLTPAGAAERYRGTPPAAAEAATEAMQFPKPLNEMLLSTHTHVLTMALIFVVTGIGVALCERPSERWRRFLIAEPFAATLVSFACIWLMRYTDPRFAWLLFASSTLMALTFYAQVGLVLWQLGAAERRA